MPTRSATVVLLIAAGLFTLSVSSAAQAQSGTFGGQRIVVEKKKSRLAMRASLKLSGDAASEFSRFKRKAKFYGAIWVNPTENVAGSFWQASNPETAETHARAACLARSQEPSGCIAYAQMLPKDHDPGQTGIRLSRQGNQDFREYTRLQDPERYGAFAISDNGAVGYSWAEHSRQSAEREALKRCDKTARKILRKTDAAGQASVATPSLHGCRLIHWAG